MRREVYADNAATTQIDFSTLNEMKPYLLSEYGNASQPYFFSKKCRNALNEARKTIATCINADEDEIFFTSSGTESDNWAIKGLMFASENKKTIVTSEIEHHAVLKACDSMQKKGFKVIKLKPLTEGDISPEDLEEKITPDTQLVSIMFANNEIGTIQPIKELVDIAHKNGSYFHSDAVQAIGHIPVDVKKLNLDLLSASAHKFNGPKGVGFLYIKKGVQIDPLLDGGGQENGLRAGTENIAGIVGMAGALKRNCDQIAIHSANMDNLTKILINKLDTMKNIKYIKNGGNNTLPGLISLSFWGADGEAIMHRLDLRGISVSTGSACDGRNANVSHVLSAIGLNEKYAKGTIRISLGKNNTESDVLYLADELSKIFK